MIDGLDELMNDWDDAPTASSNISCTCILDEYLEYINEFIRVNLLVFYGHFYRLPLFKRYTRL